MNQEIGKSIFVQEMLDTAEVEARNLNHTYISTEDLLMAAARSKIGRIILGVVGADPDVVIARTQFINGEPTEAEVESREERLPFTMRAKKVVELAIENARRNDPEKVMVTSIDYIQGLVGEGEGVAAGVLFGLSPDIDQQFDQEKLKIMRRSEVLVIEAAQARLSSDWDS